MKIRPEIEHVISTQCLEKSMAKHLLWIVDFLFLRMTEYKIVAFIYYSILSLHIKLF